MFSILSRRTIMGAMGVGTFALAAGSVGRSPSAAGAAATGGAPVIPQKLARWTVLGASAIAGGAIEVRMVGADGAPFTLQVLARDASGLTARPVAETDELAIYVANNGNGWSATNEEHGLAALTLASYLAAQNADGRGLLSLSERLATIPALTADGSAAGAPAGEQVDLHAIVGA
jgi:hypothetical protein